MTSLQRTITPLTQENWSDFEAVMGDRGGSRGFCSMHWRLKRRDLLDPDRRGLPGRAAPWPDGRPVRRYQLP